MSSKKRFRESIKAQRRFVKKYVELAKLEPKHKHFADEAKIVVAALELIRELEYEDIVIKRAELIED